jgi:hypothetical protein
MKKTTIGLLAIGSLLVAGQAMASSFPGSIAGYVGPISLKYSGYTQTVGGVTSGAVSVTDMFESSTAGSHGELAVWSPSLTDHVYAIVGGFVDSSITPSTIYSTGGTFSLYETTSTFDVSSGPSVMAAIQGAGTLLATGKFVPVDGAGDTLVQSILINGSNITGSGNAYGDVTGGPMMSQLAGHSQLFNSDLWFSFNYSHIVTGGVSNTTHWDQSVDIPGFYLTDPVVGNSVPEPATMLLFGTGLLGLAGIGRRKFQK